jgi:hypothetical protein
MKELFTLTLHWMPDRNDEKVLNDGVILFIFHVNAEVTYSVFQKMAGWPIYRAVRCRNKSFFIVPVRLLKYSCATVWYIITHFRLFPGDIVIFTVSFFLDCALSLFGVMIFYEFT